MPVSALDCARVEQGEVELRYLNGTLAADEAEAFEAHYMGCERCWASLERALELRAAFASAGLEVTAATGRRTVAGRSTRPPRVWTRRWWPMAAAASILIVLAVGVQMRRAPGNRDRTGDAVRGGTTALRVRSVSGVDTLVATWAPVRGVDRYHVRLFTGDGTLVIERDIADTSVSISLQALSRASPHEALYWSIEALDAERRPVARSPLTAALAVPRAP